MEVRSLSLMKLHFQIHYENGYNLAIDKRYNRWLRLTTVFWRATFSVSSDSTSEATRHLKKQSLYYITRKDPAGHNVVNKSCDDRNTWSELLVLSVQRAAPGSD